MTEPAERSPEVKPPGGPSGGSSSGGAAPEHLPASRRAEPRNGDRGRQRAGQQQLQQQQQQQEEENYGAEMNTDNFWRMKGPEREVCPASAAGNELPMAGANDDDVQQQDGRLEGGCGLDARLGKKRHRRRTSRKKRHWKPYFKLSWEEKKALDERETARASRVREEMFAKGLPVAPYNTTQFLMDEHDREEPDLNTETGVRRLSGLGGRLEDTGSEEDFYENNNNNDEEEEDDGSGGGGGSDGIGRPGNAGGEFLQRDFSETYEKYHVESLQNMTKQELVREYLELEKCMSRLEEENNRLRRAVEPGGVTVESSLLRLRELEGELESLRAQNTELLLQSNKDRVPEDSME